MRISICINCLQSGAGAYPIGPDKGDQRDAYRDTIDLCPNCIGALSKGDMQTLHDRFSPERSVTVQVR